MITIMITMTTVMTAIAAHIRFSPAPVMSQCRVGAFGVSGLCGKYSMSLYSVTVLAYERYRRRSHVRGHVSGESIAVRA